MSDSTDRRVTDGAIAAAARALRDSAAPVVLTGAGISKESGIPTFRDAQEGLWAQYDPTELATPRAFQRNPKRVWDWYSYRRTLLAQAEPNPGHHAIAELERVLGRSVPVITQNVDGLHRQAGSTDVLPVHGDITRNKCFANCRGNPTLIDIETLEWDPGAGPPRCPHCGAYVRPDVVWFEETLPPRPARTRAGPRRVCRCDAGGRHIRRGAARRQPALRGARQRRDRDRNQPRPDTDHRTGALSPGGAIRHGATAPGRGARAGGHARIMIAARYARRAALGVCLLAGLVALLAPTTARAQPNPPQHRIEVFLEQPPGTNTAQIYFMDPLSGLSTVARVESGRDFALLGDYVLYEKLRTGAVMRVNPDGTLQPHSFIRRAVDTVALDWVTSPDGQAVAWTTVNTAGEAAAFIAWADGSDLRQLPLLPETEGRALYPLALLDGRALFFYDAAHPIQPDDAESAAPYALYYHLAEYNITSEMIFPLPGEPNCPCAAALTPDGRIMARLEAPNGQGPFALHVWDLPSGADIVIPAPQIALRQAGDLLLNANGTLAAYSAAGGVGVEAGLLPEQYALVLVDVVGRTQRVALPPGPERYRPLAFIDGDSALLLVDMQTGGTYKLVLDDNTLLQVSNMRYLGAITP